MNGDQVMPVPMACDLYFGKDPQINIEILLAAVAKRLGEVEYVNSMFVFPNGQNETDKSRIYFRFPAEQCSFTEEQHEEFKIVFDQSRHTPNAAEIFESCRYSITLEDFMIAEHWQKRFHYFQEILLAILEHVPGAKLLHWIESQHVMTPEYYLQESLQTSAGLFGPINLRVYHDPTGQYTLVDTLGLDTMWLYDLQCNFNSKLDLREVKDRLMFYAMYIFDNSNVIQNGNTLDGMHGEKWLCETKPSIIAPERPVVDIYPGAAFAGKLVIPSHAANSSMV